MKGLNFNLTSIPKHKNRGKLERFIGSKSNGFDWVNTKAAIRKAIERKSGRYGEFEKPFIIAINVISLSCDHEDIIDALFGTEKYILNYFDNNLVPPKAVRVKDGKFQNDINTRCSGVLIVKSLNPWNVSSKNLTLYLNPWAKNPYNGKLLNLPRLILKMVS